MNAPPLRDRPPGGLVKHVTFPDRGWVGHGTLPEGGLLC